jgi:phosphoribosylformylglycinamidine synthase II
VLTFPYCNIFIAMHFVEKGIKKNLENPRANSLKEDILLFDISGVEKVWINELFFIEGDLSIDDVEKLTNEVLVDHAIEEYSINKLLDREGKTTTIVYKPGVFDEEGETLKEVANNLNYKVTKTKTGKRYIFKGEISKDELLKIQDRLLMNDLIQVAVDPLKVEFPHPSIYKFKKNIVPIREATDKELIDISKKGLLALTLEEMKIIKGYFTKEGREPTDLELETIAQTWSEHCCHKTFKSPIKSDKKDTLKKKSLFGYIKGATEEINKKNVLLSFSDNAGAIEFDKEYAVTYKAETHNHPSALEPYGGAETGVGGVIRDTMGCGLGAKPIASTDIFCFGDPETKTKNLPAGVLHPRRIVRGVIAGVRDYGNKMGIPTVGGAVYFDADFNYNPLIFVGSVGIIKKKHLKKEVKEGDLIVALGGKTGRDGIHGATFSSLSLDEQSQDVSGGAVQIGNPIEEKKMLDVQMVAKAKGLYRAATDCGAGGFSSAIGELGEKTGAVVDLEKVPLKYEGLSYWEIWVSESQERMVLAVPPENLEKLKEIFEEENVEFTIMGKFGGGRLILRYNGEIVGDLDPDFLFNKVPIPEKRLKVKNYNREPSSFTIPSDLEKTLITLLSSKNIGSRRWITQQYDHEVQGGSVLKPFAGAGSPSDGSVTRPLLSSKKAVVLGFGINPSFGKIDPYRMAASSIEESLRNLVSAGGNIENAVLLDNFCFGDTANEDVFADLFETTRACYDYAKIFETPFISGKDSLNNFFTTRGKEKKRISIPPSLLISSMSVIDNFNHAMTSNFKKENSSIILIGETKNELGGSELSRILGIKGAVPEVDGELAYSILKNITLGNRDKFFLAIHDLSEGGLALALSEMTFSNKIGCEIDISAINKNLRYDILLFSESNSRFLVEVEEKNLEAVEKLLEKIPHYKIGKTIGTSLVIKNKDKTLINIKVDEILRKWEGAVQW